MPLTEDLRTIIDEETQRCSGNAKQLAARLFEEWLALPTDHPIGAFCTHIRQEMRNRLQTRERGPARQALQRINHRMIGRAWQRERKAANDRQSVERMSVEELRAFELIQKQGKGVVYFGTARSKPGDTEYERARELSREVTILFKSTAWSGAGPGDMDAAMRGALEAGGKIGGIKIHFDEHQMAHEQEISDAFRAGEVVECQYFGPRKIGLVDAAMRDTEEDRTAAIFFPGGFGTMDEFFEFVTLHQTKKLGTRHPVPIILMNYNGEYDGIDTWLNRAMEDGRISPEDRALFHECHTNEQALDMLAYFYQIPKAQCSYKDHLHQWTPASQQNTAHEDGVL